MLRNIVLRNYSLKCANVLSQSIFHSTSLVARQTHAVECVLQSDSPKRVRKKSPQLTDSVKAIKDQYPKSLWKRQKERQNLYVADKDIANEIASKLCEDNNDVCIFEVNPGPCVLTEAVLKTGLSKVRVFESEDLFLSSLRDLSHTYPKTLEIVEKDFLRLKSSKFSEFQLCFSGIEQKQWSDGIPLKVFLTVYSKQSIIFICNMFVQLTLFSSVFSYGRCQFFLLMSDQEYSHVIAKPQDDALQYTSLTVFYNLFFNIQYLGKYPASLFLPGVKKHSQESWTQHLHLVKLTPKIDLLETILPRKALPRFHFFVWQNMRNNTDTVVEILEKWIPYCGLHFIKKGLHVFAKFKDLTPVQILEIFKQFSSLPNYSACNFHLEKMPKTRKTIKIQKLSHKL